MNLFGNNMGRWRGRTPRLVSQGAWLAAALLLLALSPSHAATFSAATLSTPQAVLWVSACTSNSTSNESDAVAWLLHSIQADTSSAASDTIHSQIESLSTFSQSHQIEFAPHLRPHMSTHAALVPAPDADFTPLSLAPRFDDSLVFARRSLFAHEAAMRSGTRPHTFLE